MILTRTFRITARARAHFALSRAEGTKRSEELRESPPGRAPRSLATPSRYSERSLDSRSSRASRASPRHCRPRERAILRRTFYKVVGTRLRYESVPRDEETRESEVAVTIVVIDSARFFLSLSLSLFSFLSLSSSSRFAPLLSALSRHPRAYVSYSLPATVLLATCTSQRYAGSRPTDTVGTDFPITNCAARVKRIG